MIPFLTQYGWVIALFLGSLVLTWLWAIIRLTDLSLSGFLLKMAPVCLLANVLYWYAYRYAPDFITCRYVMSSMTHILGWLLVIFYLKEPITANQVLGAATIIFGVWLMGRGI